MKRILWVGILAGLFLLPAQAGANEGSWVDLNSRVVSLYRSGSYKQALPLAQGALTLAESTYGTHHPYFATSLNNLAALYQAAGRFQEAEQLYQRALAIDLSLFGEGDPRVAVDRNNLQQLRQLSRPSLPPTGAEPEQSKPSQPQDYPEWDFGKHDQKPADEESKRFKFFGFEAEGSVRTGYRGDHLRWNKAGDKGGQNPNILSELTWDHLKSVTAGGTALLTRKSLIALRGSAEYGWIFAGDNQDSDYLGDNRTFEFSRSNNNSDTGHLLDVDAGIGYPWVPEGLSYEFRLIPLVGYSYHEQALTITDGFQTIPSTGTFAGLDSRYRAEWRGPWVGFDLDFKPYEKILFYGGFEYHRSSYLANARWNLRTDFSQPKSFRHTATGWGIVGVAGMTYRLSDKWFIDGNAKIQSWTTSPGIDRIFFSDGTTTEDRLNEVRWNSYTVSLGLRHLF